MGKKAREIRMATRRRIRAAPLDDTTRQRLNEARYEGSSDHKRNPEAFGLRRSEFQRPDVNFCEDWGITEPERARALFSRAVEHGLVSEFINNVGFPQHIWVVDEQNRVFEASYGGSRMGYYHGYPIRRTDPLSDQVLVAWNRNQ